MMLRQTGRAQPSRAARRTGRSSRKPLVTFASAQYDYIIVGGGTAGCVLANRLTEDGSKKVLVLEAGGNGGALETRVPAALTRLFQHPTLDWNLFSTQQRPLGDRDVYLARGKTLGGSSSTNATLYLRGTPEDYDAWGLEGWRSQDVLPWFVNAECNTNFGNSRYHGQAGAMAVESPRYQNPLHEEFFRAAAQAGIPENRDFNDWSRPQVGYGEFQVAQKRGQRADAFTQYLQPAKGRSNLTVLTGARTTRVAFEQGSSGTRAVGVEYAVGGRGSQRQTAELAAGGQVIMSAGTVHTPQILMLSGVGPAQQLVEQGVQLVADAPGLGSNLQDHPATLFAALAKPDLWPMFLTSEIYNDSYNIRLGAVLKLLLLGAGPLATTGCDHGAFVSTTGSGPADLQIRFVPAFSLDADAIKSYIRFDEAKKEGKRWPGGVTMQLLACRPASRGSVGLASGDPFDLPSVDLGYFTDAGGADLRTLMEGVKLARRICEQPALAQYVQQEGWPGAGVQTEADLEAYVRRSACSGNALVGTARMGGSPTDGSVVSSRDFGVWGVQNLKVVDASVIPQIPGGQTAAAVVMIAERAAQALKAGAGAGSGATKTPALV